MPGPLFKWFGSKWSASKHYPRPLYDTIVEPFAGGAGYAPFVPFRRSVTSRRKSHNNHHSNELVWIAEANQ